MHNFKRYTLTAALPYANGPLHIGHMAGVYVPADIYARFLRRTGQDVVFIGGSDEHGIPITIRAKKENRSPQQVVDEFHTLIKSTMLQMGISFDHYSRTSSKKHKITASDFFKNLYDKGKFETTTTEQFYDEEAQEFLADRYIVGECPNCGYDSAYGDQCERCGATLSPSELINPKSALSGNQPVLKETQNWFLPLNEYEDFLKQWLTERKEEWKTNVYGQVMSWINQGLKPRAMTRDLNWGVPVPLPGAEGKVLYVWFDAPIGYITATKEWATQNGKNWEQYWKSEDTQLVHFIGKDNIVFHCVIFPAMLKAHGGYILPNNVPANEFMNLENQKISTSRNWAVWVHEYLEEFPNQQDALRFALTANMPETKDNNFTWKDFQTKNNSELVGILGNFFNRVLVLLQKYHDGKIPKASDAYYAEIQKALNYRDLIVASIEKFEFRNALAEFMNLARFGNQFLQKEEPWKKIKTQPELVDGIMNAAAQIAALTAQLAEPFIPFAAQKMVDLLNMQAENWQDLNLPLLNETHEVNKPELIFNKIEDEIIQKQMEKLTKNQPIEPNSETNSKPIIAFDDFQKLDLRIGTIKEAKKVEKADRLLELQVDFGEETRTVVSGVAESFSPDEIIGKQVVAVYNLAPRKIRGIESHGMLLLSDTENGKLTFISPEQEVKNGTTVN